MKPNQWVNAVCIVGAIVVVGLAIVLMPWSRGEGTARETHYRPGDEVVIRSDDGHGCFLFPPGPTTDFGDEVMRGKSVALGTRLRVEADRDVPTNPESRVRVVVTSGPDAGFVGTAYREFLVPITAPR